MPSIFSLEAFNARHGDALLLHVGEPGAMARILIDGGPAGTYTNTVKPRIEAIAEQDPNARIDHVFVTHLDDDHVRGVLDYFKEVEHGLAPLDCNSAWFNVFDDIQQELPAELAAQRDNLQAGARSSAVLASVAQGVDLANIARRIPLRVNGGTGSLLIADDAGRVLDVLPDLKVTLVAPSRKRVDALFKEWQKKVAANDADAAVVTADYVDKSVFNLSSLVMVVEAGGENGKKVRVLLTGDSRGDDVLAGLADAGFIEDGTAHFDLLKVAHHGSDRNYEAEFFTKVSADFYVISADGNYANPSEETLLWIAQSRAPDAIYQVWLTNQTSDKYPALQKNLENATRAAPELGAHLHFRDAARASLVIDLLDPLPLV